MLRETSMRRWSGWPRRCAQWRNLALPGLAFLASCGSLRPVPEPGPVPGARMVNVGLLVDTTEVELGATTDWQLVDSGGRVLHRLNTLETAVARPNADGSLTVRIGDQETRTSSGLTARASAGGLVSIGGKPYRGTALVRSLTPNRVTAINHVDMESYLLGVVPFEIGRVGPELLEASKA